MPIDDSTLAPTYEIEVENKPIGEGIKDLIDHVEFESADGIADMGRIRMVNPDSIISNAKAFQPGKEMSVWMGYGSGNLEHIGRCEIIRNRPNFPQGGQPTLEVVGYTKDSTMSENTPKKPENKKRKSGDRTYLDQKVNHVVEQIGDMVYGFETDVDVTLDKPHDFSQAVGMNDYEFIKGLANETGYLFWVDADSFGVWTLNFKDPLMMSQDNKYTFKYNEDGSGTLLSFTPDLLIKGSYTKLIVTVKDVRTGKMMETEIEEDNLDTPDTVGEPFERVQGELSTASDIKIFFNSYSFKEISDRRFKTEDELKHWARQWFRRHRENFVLSRARTIGVETVKARQIHGITGTSSLYNGDYYFSKVKHVMNKSNGYILDIGMRKQTP